MAFDQTTRNQLQKFVSDARDLLTKEFIRQLQFEYGMDPATGEVSDLDRLAHLDDNRRETARLLRDTLEHYLAGSPSRNVKECLDRIVREQAFTVLNRLCALRMAEARGILIESIGNGYKSKGFQLYARLAGAALGETGDAYRCYLFSIFDEFALDLAVLFDRFSPQGRLFPGESVLLELLDLINHPDIAPLWAEDETIGWIYQYFNSPEERRKMRAESQAPRNSRELAVRNQFFTPRYVVEFLTDNTLGRIWYEMTRGNTVLKDQCRYLVRRPNEIFLAEGEEAPQQDEPAENLSQEELLKQPVYIPYRQLKDPREIRMLDPACGSMHFGLYAFDLFEKIYEEAWELEGQLDAGVFARSEKFKPLRETYESKEALMRDVPRLIIEHNIHGIDIDPRAVQIAGLSLWLRAQRSWQARGVKPQDRPQILKSNVVCAEPMPGDKEMLREFTEGLEPRVLGQLVEIIFDKMQLAGEAGSLLKIEEEIEEAIAEAREEFSKELLRRQDAATSLFPEFLPPRQQTLYDFTDLPDNTQFWNEAERKILDALREYAEQAEAMRATRKRLFARDAARGFAFIDICRKRYDVVLMNPPFGEIPTGASNYIAHYSGHSNNMLCSFLIRSFGLSHRFGHIGAIIDKTATVKSSYFTFREYLLKGMYRIRCFADLGWGVLDGAQVETVLMTLSHPDDNLGIFFKASREEKDLAEEITRLLSGQQGALSFLRPLSQFNNIPNQSISYDLPEDLWSLLNSKYRLEPDIGVARQGLGISDSWRWYRLRNEVPPNLVESDYCVLANGGGFSPFYRDLDMIIYWKDDGKHIKVTEGEIYGSWSRTVKNVSFYFRKGISFPKRTDFLNAHLLPIGCVFTVEGLGFFVENGDEEIWTALGLLNSRLHQYLINSFCGQHKHVGYIKKLPAGTERNSKRELLKSIADLVKDAFQEKRSWSTLVTNGIFFTTPACISCSNPSYPSDIAKDNISLNNALRYIKEKVDSSRERLKQIQQQLDNLVFDFYEVTEHTKQLIIEETKKRPTLSPLQGLFEEGDTRLQVWIADFIDACVGYTLGRWDVRIALDLSLAPKLPDPFDPLPVCPPGTLVGPDGLPAKPCSIVSEEWLRARPDANSLPPEGTVKKSTIPDSEYPLRISWRGILVDDEGHPEDIVGRVREAIEVIWKDKAGDIEQEACEILGVRSLRDYFHKPTGFFEDHLKRYSKSRRKAPIYWPISTASGSYTLWLYYHRLTDQTLYTCVNDFVEPKLKEVVESASRLRQKSRRSRAEEKELERLSDLELELKEFRDELLRIAAFWKPNLNDGVQITAAPLWKLFRHTSWRKTLKKTWHKLEKGDYDWAHLAYSIWPDRVREKCKYDKSLAIAHGLEELYEERPSGSKKKRGGRRGKKQ